MSILRMKPLPGTEWLLPFGALLTLLGYFGPWVNHKAAALVVTGLDLAEYVKFLVPIQLGEIQLWRESFYLPLIAVSLSLTLSAFRRELDYGWPVAVVMLLGAGIAALNMLPPAWSPGLLLTPEFRLQTAAIGFCLAAALTSPMLSLLPARLVYGVVVLIGLITLILPMRNFLRILPTIQGLYNQSFWPGWGLFIMEVGLLFLIAGSWFNMQAARLKQGEQS